MRPPIPSWSGKTGDAATSDHAAKNLPTTTGPALGWLAKPSVIFGLIGLYLLGHLTLRLMLSPTLGIDDAEQILFAQHWAFGYRFRQPPLFTWMLLPVIDLVGPGVLAVSLVRYAFLGITYVFLYLTARLCLHDQRMAGLAVLSFALIYVFAYYAHHDLTHTTALGAMIALTFYAIARLAKNPTWPAYLMAGVILGFGMLAKWNFAMLVIGLPLTCLLLKDLRPLVITPKIIATLAVMLAILTPTALWVFAHGQSIDSVSSDILSQDGTRDGLTLWFDGMSALFRSTLLFPLPFLPIFLLMFGRSLAASFGAPTHIARTTLPSAFFGYLMLIVLALHALLIPLFGAVNFTERWLHPALMGLPFFLFALAERGRISDQKWIHYLVIIAILVIFAAGARLYRFAEGVDDCGRCREFAPFAELAEGLRTAGFSGGTIVADGLHIGGNLQMHFPESRVIDPAFPRGLWPDFGNHDTLGSCLLVWRQDSDHPKTRRNMIKNYAIKELGLLNTAPSKTGRLDAPLLGSSDRHYVLGFEFFRESTGGCR